MRNAPHPEELALGAVGFTHLLGLLTTYTSSENLPINYIVFKRKDDPRV